MKDVSDDAILQIIRKCYSIPVITQTSVERIDRLYSTTWRVSDPNRGSSGSYIVKCAGERAQKQFQLSRRADRILSGQGIHASPGLRFEPRHNLIVARIFPGRSLEAMMAQGRATHPGRWYRDLSRTLHLAGVWLRQYHAVERHGGSISEPLMRYLERRKDKVDQLSASSRERLLRLIGTDLRDDVVVTHSDYSPGNILSNGRALCVVDFGIEEWTEMSPWWDVLTLLVTLDRFFLLRALTPHSWARPLLSRFRGTFLSAYGDLPPHLPRAYLACAAVRHLSLASGLAPEIVRTDARARWHARQLERVLDEADSLSAVLA